MLFCFDTKLPFDYSKNEMAISKNNNSGILYNSDEKEFIDFDGKKIDINGKIIFPRTGSSQIYDMNNEIEKQGGIPIITNEQVDMVEVWPNFYCPNRKIKVLKGTDLIDKDVINEIESTFGSFIFFKTVTKNFSGVIPIELLKDTECNFYKSLSYHLDEEFIISEKVDVTIDEYGKKEYRCFVCNNQVYNISRYTTNVLHSIDESVLERANEIIKSMDNKFPKYYVLDLFEYRDGNQNFIDVLEINPIHASGLYLYNSAMERSSDLLHLNLKNISKEFLCNLDKCSIDGKIISTSNEFDNLYYNGFSKDLLSICLTGDVGLLFAADVILTVDDFSKHSSIHNYDELEEMEEETYTPVTDEYFLNCDNGGIESSEDIEEAIQKLLSLYKK